MEKQKNCSSALICFGNAAAPMDGPLLLKWDIEESNLYAENEDVRILYVFNYQRKT